MHFSHNCSNNNLIHRKTHPEQFSTPKLSSETVHTLPEYSSPHGWGSALVPSPLVEAESDRPPDYPEATGEGDTDTEADQEEHIVYAQHCLVHSPLAPQRSSAHVRRRKQVPASRITSDHFLDALLERSVHALETSNTLLYTTMSMQSSLSTLLSSENEPDHFLEARARNLSTRIRVNGGVRETWMDRLEEISEGVDWLLGGEGRSNLVCRSSEDIVSRSLPATTLPDLRHRRKPSILELNGSSNPHLRYSHPTRDILVAPAPRALTQFVESNTDPQSISLPSTLGLRTSGSFHSFHSQKSLSAHCYEAQPRPMAIITPQAPSDNTTPAYHLLSNLAQRSGSLTSPSSTLLLRSTDRCTPASSKRTTRGTKLSFSPSSTQTFHCFPDRGRAGTQSRTLTPSCSDMLRKSTTPPTPLPMLPPDEELSPSSSESSDHPTGYRTVQSLRKILDDHPTSSSTDNLQRKDTKLHTPVFLPVTPLPVPTQGTSTATASISRLYTRGRHSMSTRPPSPPAHSSLKVRSVPPTPAPSPSTTSLSEVFGHGMARVTGSASSSGVSTPKRISFAEPPESYSGSQPGTSKLLGRKSRKERKQMKGSDKEERSGWLKVLLYGGLSSGGLDRLGDREERMGERMTRGWGSRPGYGTLDDWAV